MSSLKTIEKETPVCWHRIIPGTFQVIYMTVGISDQFRNAGSLEIERGMKPGDLEKVLELILF